VPQLPRHLYLDRCTNRSAFLANNEPIEQSSLASASEE
jgi:hypothetical protein